jgi:hypothetical protein
MTWIGLTRLTFSTQKWSMILSKSFTFIMAHPPSQQGSYAPVTAIPVSNDDPLAERFVGAVTAETVSTEAMPLEVVAPASLPEVSCTCITLLV